METVVSRKLYEGMFLVDSAQASDWDATTATLEDVLKRADAEIVSMKRWDDRRLAYEVNGKIRGTYILCYFKADGEKIQEVEKAVQLSERIMRVLILSAEQMTAEDIEKDTPAARAQKEEAAAEEARAARVAKATESAEKAEPEQEGSMVVAAEAAVVEAVEGATEDETTEENAEMKESDGSEKPEEPGEVKEPQELDSSDAGEAATEAESERPKEQNL